ncbi:sigma-70 family RNA polymerase sigma factor [Jannaschia donghaensis]|uniref:Sigma-K factor n=1 Tax=Jannaschia donghaensis TaxID=420998 RepID=A0A0M6YKT4_9RHOB|nr:sigma-70 family RNA polymerase sigma factor [Jannaschia donghaensis]CTQ49656.1 Sigma-K factor [Jannaschia donghaensis]
MTIAASETAHHWATLLLAVGSDRNTDAFEALFRHFAPRVKSYLMRTGLTPAMAEDCMQDVMVTLWRKAHLYDPARAGVSTWLFTIARNRKIDLIRRSTRPEPEDLSWGPEAAPDQADALALSQEADRLAEAIADLPAAQRDMVRRAYFADATHAEIAAATGLPLGTIKSRIRLAIDRLRHAMQSDGSGAPCPASASDTNDRRT